MGAVSGGAVWFLMLTLLSGAWALTAVMNSSVKRMALFTTVVAVVTLSQSVSARSSLSASQLTFAMALHVTFRCFGFSFLIRKRALTKLCGLKLQCSVLVHTSLSNRLVIITSRSDEAGR